jgi:hypothetical protein
MSAIVSLMVPSRRGSSARRGLLPLVFLTLLLTACGDGSGPVEPDPPPQFEQTEASLDNIRDVQQGNSVDVTGQVGARMSDGSLNKADSALVTTDNGRTTLQDYDTPIKDINITVPDSLNETIGQREITVKAWANNESAIATETYQIQERPERIQTIDNRIQTISPLEGLVIDEHERAHVEGESTVTMHDGDTAPPDTIRVYLQHNNNSNLIDIITNEHNWNVTTDTLGPGDYTVRAVAAATRSGERRTAEANKDFHVNYTPNLTLDIQGNLTEGETTSFTLRADDPDGSITNAHLQLGDMEWNGPTPLNADVTFNDGGDKTITYSATDNNQATTEQDTTINVTNLTKLVLKHRNLTEKADITQVPDSEVGETSPEREPFTETPVTYHVNGQEYTATDSLVLRVEEGQTTIGATHDAFTDSFAQLRTPGMSIYNTTAMIDANSPQTNDIAHTTVNVQEGNNGRHELHLYQIKKSDIEETGYDMSDIKRILNGPGGDIPMIRFVLDEGETLPAWIRKHEVLDEQGNVAEGKQPRQELIDKMVEFYTSTGISEATYGYLGRKHDVVVDSSDQAPPLPRMTTEFRTQEAVPFGQHFEEFPRSGPDRYEIQLGENDFYHNLTEEYLDSFDNFFLDLYGLLLEEGWQSTGKPHDIGSTIADNILTEDETRANPFGLRLAKINYTSAPGTIFPEEN